jgi:hypothetical protein
MTQTASLNSSAAAHTTGTTPTTTQGIGPSSSAASANTSSTTFTPQGALLGAIIATTIILFIILVTLTVLSLSWRRRALEKKPPIAGKNISYPSQHNLITPSFTLSHLPASTKGGRSTYAASLASSSKYVRFRTGDFILCARPRDHGGVEGRRTEMRIFPRGSSDLQLLAIILRWCQYHHSHLE